MADEGLTSNTTTAKDLGKDPVFLLMVTGQIESAEVCSVLKARLGQMYLIVSMPLHIPFSFLNMMNYTVTTPLFMVKTGL